MKSKKTLPIELRSEKYQQWLKLTAEILQEEVKYNKDSDWDNEGFSPTYWKYNRYLSKTSDLYQVSVDLNKLIRLFVDETLTVWFKK